MPIQFATDQYSDLSVTTAKVGAGAITSAKLASGAVDSAALSAGAKQAALESKLVGRWVQTAEQANPNAKFLDIKTLLGFNATAGVDPEGAVKGKGALIEAASGVEFNTSSGADGRVGSSAKARSSKCLLVDANGDAIVDAAGDEVWGIITCSDGARGTGGTFKIRFYSGEFGSGAETAYTMAQAFSFVYGQIFDLFDVPKWDEGTIALVDKEAAQLAAGQVNTAEIADNAVTQAKMADNSVGTAEIVDLNVTTAKLAADAVTYAKIQNVSATDKLLGRSTAGAGDVEEIACTAAGRALLDDADASAQRSTLGLGALAVKSTVATADIDNDAVTYAKIQNVTATDKLLGRSTAGAGDVEEIACTAAGRALLDDASAADQRTTLGLGALAVKSTIATADIDALAVTEPKLAANVILRMAEVAMDDRAVSVSQGKGFVDGAGAEGAVTAQGTPNASVKVATGGVAYNNRGDRLVFASLDPINLVARTTNGNTRKDIIVINAAGTVVVRQGTEGASPADPALTAGDVPLARVNIDDEATLTVESGDITDLRERNSVDGAKLLGSTVTQAKLSLTPQAFQYAGDNALTQFAASVGAVIPSAWYPLVKAFRNGARLEYVTGAPANLDQYRVIDAGGVSKVEIGGALPSGQTLQVDSLY